MKIVGLCILHYGKEYLGAAIQAVAPICEEIIISYTPKPSHGHQTNIDCPETIEEITEEIKKYDSGKIIFKSGIYSNEGDHRGQSLSLCKLRDADIVVVFDADEVWDTESLRKAILVMLTKKNRYYGIAGYVNFWKSFNTVVHDQFRPVRLINLTVNEETQGEVDGTIYHFGCAQSEKIMRYKYLIHGHHDELRSNWLEETYFKWETKKDQDKGDLHPVAIGLWQPSHFNKDSLPQILKEHPNFSKTTI